MCFLLLPGKVLKQSYWVHTAVSLVCTYCIVDISDCFPVVPLICFIRFPWQSKQTDVSIPAVWRRLWCAACLPTCRGVNSNSDFAVLVSSVCSRCCAGVSKNCISAPERESRQATHFSCGKVMDRLWNSIRVWRRWAQFRMCKPLLISFLTALSQRIYLFFLDNYSLHEHWQFHNNYPFCTI